jgi:hypothetical protein
MPGAAADDDFEFTDPVIHAAVVVYLKTEQEILDVVATAAKNNRKIKVGTKSCHSICKLVCPGGNETTASFSAG